MQSWPAMSGNDGSGTGLILFMGRRAEHARTSIQKYVPEVVHIITSDQFKAQHKRRLKEWSQQFGFREGEVKSIDDLFEQSAVTSLLNEVMSIYHQELELQKSEFDWYLGITGGTMNMAATGSYAGLLMNMKIFYVIQPPKGGKPMPNRDVIEFPQLQGLGWMMSLPHDTILFLSQGSGEMKELAGIMNEFTFSKLFEAELIMVDEDKWYITEEGQATLEMVGTTPMSKDLLSSKFSKMQEDLNSIKNSLSDDESFVGWA